MSKYEIEEEQFHMERSVVNDHFGDVQDFAVDTILNRKIKAVYFGARYHYMTYRGQVRAYMSKRKNRNFPLLILKGDQWELECHVNDWQNIIFKSNEIRLEDIGLYIVFSSPIWNLFQTFRKQVFKENE